MHAETARRQDFETVLNPFLRLIQFLLSEGAVAACGWESNEAIFEKTSASSRQGSFAINDGCYRWQQCGVSCHSIGIGLAKVRDQSASTSSTTMTNRPTKQLGGDNFFSGHGGRITETLLNPFLRLIQVSRKERMHEFRADNPYLVLLLCGSILRAGSGRSGPSGLPRVCNRAHAPPRGAVQRRYAPLGQTCSTTRPHPQSPTQDRWGGSIDRRLVVQLCP